jgi:hypothetical protein
VYHFILLAEQAYDSCPIISEASMAMTVPRLVNPAGLCQAVTTSKIRTQCVAGTLLTLFVIGCGARAPRQGETTMPNPEGCFVQVWDGPRHTGITDYVNGPKAWPNLRDMPGARVWANRIRSMKTGVTARAIVYAGENFEDANIRLVPDRDYPVLPEAISGRIASMNIECIQPTSTKAE